MTCHASDARVPESNELPRAERAKLTDVLPEGAVEVFGKCATQVYRVNAHLPGNGFQRPIILEGIVQVFQQQVHPGRTVRRSLDPDIRIPADEIEQKSLSDQSRLLIAKREFAVKCD
jgi:hypothetical protein